MRRSSTNRRSTPGAPCWISLMATRCSNCPSARSPRNTRPIPPRPISRTTRKGPIISDTGPATAAVASRSGAASRAAGDSSTLSERWYARTSSSTSARSAASSPHSRSMNAVRSPGGMSTAASKMLSTRRNRSVGVALTAPPLYDVLCLPHRGAGSRLVLAGDLPVEPALRLGPVALRRAQADAERLGRLLLRHPAEESALHDLGLSCIDLLEPSERVVDRDQLLGSLLGAELHVVDRDALEHPAALRAAVAARVIDEDPPHRRRGDGHEVRAPLPFHAG